MVLNHRRTCLRLCYTMSIDSLRKPGQSLCKGILRKISTRRKTFSAHPFAEGLLCTHNIHVRASLHAFVSRLCQIKPFSSTFTHVFVLMSSTPSLISSSVHLNPTMISFVDSWPFKYNLSEAKQMLSLKSGEQDLPTSTGFPDSGITAQLLFRFRFRFYSTNLNQLL